LYGSLVFPTPPANSTTTDVYLAVGIVGRLEQLDRKQAASRWRQTRSLARELFWAAVGGGADLAAGGLGELHPQGQARSFMAAPTRISRDSMDRDARQTMM
jgi:hypothetical protein